jgi:hypothetical protein
VSAPSPTLVQAEVLTGTKSRTAKATSSAGQRPELKIIFDELPAEHSLTGDTTGTPCHPAFCFF